MLTLLRDLRYSLRQLRRAPGLMVIAILTLALGIGANTTMFTVIESVLLRPLPYTNAERLFYIGKSAETPAFDATSWLNYRDIRDQAHTLESAAGYSNDVGVVETKDSTVSVVAPRVTPNLFSMLGVQPLLGRTFSDAEGLNGGPQAVILSEGLWRQSFHADPTILGRVVKVSGIPRTVVGVMRDSFRFPEETGADVRKGLWLPLQPTSMMENQRGLNFFEIVGKARPGTTMAQVQSEVDAITERLRKSGADGTSQLTFHAWPYQEMVTGEIRPVLYALFAAVGLVLLIACVNVSNLLIARCMGRQQEFAVRSALGASRTRLVVQMLAEGATLSILGCAAGVGLARLALMGLQKLPSGTIPRADSIALHADVTLILVAIATLTTVLSSLLPALLVMRTDPQPALQAASRGVGGRSTNGRLSGWLVIAEVALSTLLLVGTGLLFHTLWNLERAQLGFDTQRVSLFAAMPADAAGFSQLAVSKDTEHAPVSIATTIYAPVLERIRNLPGVQSAALVTAPPLGGVDMNSSFDVPGEQNDKAHRRSARLTAVSGDYARTMGTPMLRGRMIEESDSATSPYVAVINEALAKKYFHGQDPLQKQVELGGKDTGMVQPYRIVGVMANQADAKVGAEAKPFMLLSQYQVPTTSLFYQALLGTFVNFTVKTRGDVSVAPEIRSIFHQIAPNFAIDNFQTMQESVEQNTFSQRLGLYLIGSFAGLAVVMVIAGLYGVLAQLVSHRRREFGIRMALGATRQSVSRLVLTQGSFLIGVGLAVGIAVALMTGRLLRGFLYQVGPMDLWTYVAVGVMLAVIGLLAALLPAYRAASIEPMRALREE